MINLPRINITSNKILLIILFLSIIFYTLIYLDINKIAVMIFILLFFVFYNQVIKNTKSFFFKKRERDENYNNKIEELLYELNDFEKLSPYKYYEGYNIWKKFIKTITKLESENLYNYNQYFLYLLVYNYKTIYLKIFLFPYYIFDIILKVLILLNSIGMH